MSEHESNLVKRARVLARLAQPDADTVSDRAIARELDVSQPFVSALRKARVGASTGPGETTGEVVDFPLAARDARASEAPGAPPATNTFDAAAAIADLETELALVQDEAVADEARELEVRAAILRGTATRDELTLLVRRRLARTEQRALLSGLLTQARELHAEQIARERDADYAALVAEHETRFAEAIEAAIAVDAAIDALLVAVPQLAACLHVSALVRAAARMGVPDLARQDRGADLSAFIVRRLKPVLPGMATSVAANDRTVAAAVEGWTSRFIAAARQRPQPTPVDPPTAEAFARTIGGLGAADGTEEFDA